MGWKGTVRSIGAAVRAAEREAKRRQRELERQQKQYAKMRELEQAEYEVELYENHIEIIQSLHTECSEPINWEAIATSQEPQKPENQKIREHTARLEAENYTAGFIDKLFKQEGKKKEQLANNIVKAIKEDETEYRAAIDSWKKALNDWEESVDLAKRLLSGNNEAKMKAIKELDPFSEISALGSSISFLINDKEMVEATVHIHSDNIVPKEIKSLLKSGKLSTKKMPNGRFNEIYQDYVCSCVLRIGNELFSVIPDTMVVVTAVDTLLNTKTGHLEEAPILSVCIPRKTLESINLNNIDPSNSMSNFLHNMSFKKAVGFEAVSKISLEDIETL